MIMTSIAIYFANAILAMLLPCTSVAIAADTYINPKAIDTIEWLPSSQSDYRILYSTNPSNFGDLRVPKISSPSVNGHPVLVFVHGGAWTADWTLGHTEQLVEALSKEGIATWSIEYRRLGNAGGGYPETFLDVAKALDFLRKLAPKHQLDLSRVVVAGHSSGGHLALWLAGRRNLPKESKLYISDPLSIRGVVSIAGVVDLEGALIIGDRSDSLQLLNVPDANAATSLWPETNPMRLLPFGIPQVLIVGTKDNPWRVTITKSFAQTATEKGDNVRLMIPEGANHFDVVHAHGPAYPIISSAVKSLLGMPTVGPQ
jgi:acetyl esterase/lipase